MSRHDEHPAETSQTGEEQDEQTLDRQLTREELLKFMENLKKNHFVFMWGMPASGKTVVLASLLYAMQCPGHRGTFTILGTERASDFHDGYLLAEELMGGLQGKEFPGRTKVNRRAFEIHGTYQLPPERKWDIVFLEMSGEDVAMRLTDTYLEHSGSLPVRIENYLQDKSRLVFLFTVPWNRTEYDDRHLAGFLSALFEKDGKNGRLQQSDRIMLLITQWDSCPDRHDTDIREFVRVHLPRSYQLLQNVPNVVLQPFSIGEVVQFQNAAPIIREVDVTRGQNLFKRILESLTGESLDSSSKSWWKFGSN
jgi:hypothetical protein